jgi:hypothetical protein
MMANEVPTKQLVSFGFTVGGIFALIAAWPLIIRGDEPRWWAGVVAGCLLLPAAVLPRSLTWIYKGWMLLGHVLGWINTRIILGFIFFGIVTPIGIIRRWLGKDPMGRRLRPELDSYRVTRTLRPASHLTKQY